jgi:hypothetical protein
MPSRQVRSQPYPRLRVLIPLRCRFGPRTPVDALLEKYAQDILDTEPPSASASDEELRTWRAQVRERAGNAIGEIRRMTSQTANKSPASLLTCPTVNASGAGTQPSRSEVINTKRPR